MQPFALEHAEWLWPAASVWIAILIATMVSYWGSSLTIPSRLLGLVGRGVGSGLILLCLLEPTWVVSVPKPQSNLVGIVMDTSRSMTSLNVVRERDPVFLGQLANTAAWQSQLEQTYRLRRYHFDASLQPDETLEGLEWKGSLSSFHEAMETLRIRYAGRPLAGLVLLTDGLATDEGSGRTEEALLEGWKTLGCPFYPVRLSTASALKDLSIGSVGLRQSDFEAAPVTLTAMLTSRGLVGEMVVVELLDESGVVLESKNVKLGSAPTGTAVEYRFRPVASGVQRYALRARLASEPATWTDPQASAKSQEVTLGNNQRFQIVDRGRGPYRVLYVAGRPNWEHKFLRRALEEDGELKLGSLIRIAKKEPKFSFRDTRVDSSNPLFSGFEGISEEEKEQYKDPVYIRLGEPAQEGLQNGFPKDPEVLFSYHAVILDDLEFDFLDQEQQILLRRFVTDRGGGLLVLGGQESMRGKGFRDSIMAQLLPVYGEERERTEVQPTYRVELTREGWQQPFLRTSATEKEERKQRELMPAFEVLNRTTDVKPGASVLAEAIEESGRHPALVWQRFGKGRSSCLMVGDLWRWGMHPSDPENANYLAQSWRQMVRWLITDVPKRFVMTAEPESSQGRAQRLRVEAKTLLFEPLDNAKVKVTVTKPSGAKLELDVDPSSDRLGCYETVLVQDEEGAYGAEATITSPDGMEVGTAQAGWVHEPSVLEFREVGFQEERLQRLAEATGGEVLDLEELDTLSRRLAARPVPIMERKVTPIWHQGLVIGLAMMGLCLEWGLRRWRGLA